MDYQETAKEMAVQSMRVNNKNKYLLLIRPCVNRPYQSLGLPTRLFQTRQHMIHPGSLRETVPGTPKLKAAHGPGSLNKTVPNKATHDPSRVSQLDCSRDSSQPCCASPVTPLLSTLYSSNPPFPAINRQVQTPNNRFTLLSSFSQSRNFPTRKTRRK